MSAPLPKHVAFIMDGNGRWATARGLERLDGHRQGIETVKKAVEEGLNLKIPYLTFYAFSMENWERPQPEVDGLMNLLGIFFKSELSTLKEKNIQVRFIGDRSPQSKLAPDIIELLTQVEDETRDNTALTLVFAINYSGRDEIIRAAQLFAEDVDAGRRYASDFDENIFSQYMDTIDIPDPDLMIRTSGEQRISNFLLWQLAYTELYFSDKSWPDFAREDFHAALSAYTQRERRFGNVLSA